MKIADALLLQQDLATEISRLRSLSEQKAWSYAQQRGVGEELVATFDLEENHKRVMNLSKLKRTLSRAVSVANNTVAIVVDENDYKEWM